VNITITDVLRKLKDSPLDRLFFIKNSKGEIINVRIEDINTVNIKWDGSKYIQTFEDDESSFSVLLIS